jgi:type II secretion system protein H
MTRGQGLSRGFTLIELVVVVAILAVVAALVGPAVGRGTEGLTLRSEAGRVAGLLRQARQHAVSQHRPTRVELDRARNRVTMTAAGADHPARELGVAAGFRMRVELGGDALTFSSRGRARETRWVLEAPRGRALAIHVDALSGRVSVAPEDRS